MAKRKKDVRELDEIHDAENPKMRDALGQMVIASLREDNDAAEGAERSLARTIADAQSLADLYGRRRLVLQLAASGKRLFADAPSLADAFRGRVPFTEAVDAVLSRYPVVARGWRAARDAYQSGAYALARSSNEVVTKHIRGVIVNAIGAGRPRDRVIDDIVEALGQRRYGEPQASYVSAYADTVFRTNTTTAYAEGRFEQARDPEVAPFVGAFRYDATLDGDVRANHRAADGFVAAVNDPAWNVLRPPLGYNCRCALGIVTTEQAKRAGVIDADGSVVYASALPRGAGPDAGFRA